MMTIESVVDESISDLKRLRGALLGATLANGKDAGDYCGVIGQKDAIVCLVEKQLEALDKVVENLMTVAPADGINSADI